MTGIYVLLGIIAIVVCYTGYEVYKLLKADFSVSDISEIDE